MQFIPLSKFCTNAGEFTYFVCGLVCELRAGLACAAHAAAEHLLLSIAAKVHNIKKLFVYSGFDKKFYF